MEMRNFAMFLITDLHFPHNFVKVSCAIKSKVMFEDQHS